MQPSPRPFVSFSINREDVLLNRLFGAQHSGFFVDVGAADPVFENDTKALSDRGWTGINIEPNVMFFRALEQKRPQDRNLNVAVGDLPGPMTFHEVVDTGLSTLDPEAAQEAASKGFTVVDHQIEVRSLREILDTEAVQAIDLLKIDVEGFELRVLASNDWDRFRPRLIMTEATYPQTPMRRPDHITPFLAEHDYRHVHFDGLNDYYAEAGFSIGDHVFGVPLNVFDQVTPYSQVLLTQARDSLACDVAALTKDKAQSEISIGSLKASLRVSQVWADECSSRMRAMTVDLQLAHKEISNLRSEITELMGAGAKGGTASMVEQVQGLQSQISQLQASSSWRVTRPLRAIAHPRRTLMLILQRLSR